MPQPCNTDIDWHIQPLCWYIQPCDIDVHWQIQQKRPWPITNPIQFFTNLEIDKEMLFTRCMLFYKRTNSILEKKVRRQSNLYFKQKYDDLMSILEARRTKDFHLASLLNSSNSSIPFNTTRNSFQTNPFHESGSNSHLTACWICNRVSFQQLKWKFWDKFIQTNAI